MIHQPAVAIQTSTFRSTLLAQRVRTRFLGGCKWQQSQVFAVELQQIEGEIVTSAQPRECNFVKPETHSRRTTPPCRRKRQTSLNLETLRTSGGSSGRLLDCRMRKASRRALRDSNVHPQVDDTATAGRNEGNCLELLSSAIFRG